MFESVLQCCQLLCLQPVAAPPSVPALPLSVRPSRTVAVSQRPERSGASWSVAGTAGSNPAEGMPAYLF